jgi:hypothetical protein
MRRLTGFWVCRRCPCCRYDAVPHPGLTVFLLDPWLFLGYSVGLFSILTFLLFPGTKKGRKGVQAIDIALSLLSIAVMVYLTLNYEEMYYRVGYAPETLDWVFGLTAVVTVLEMTRRLMGLFFPIMALFFILYAIFGGALPGILGHRGYELSRTMSTIFSTEGLYASASAAAMHTFCSHLRRFVRATGRTVLHRPRHPSPAGYDRPRWLSASALFGMHSGVPRAMPHRLPTIPLMKHVDTARPAGASRRALTGIDTPCHGSVVSAAEATPPLP